MSSLLTALSGYRGPSGDSTYPPWDLYNISELLAVLVSCIADNKAARGARSADAPPCCQKGDTPGHWNVSILYSERCSKNISAETRPLSTRNPHAPLGPPRRYQRAGTGRLDMGGRIGCRPVSLIFCIRAPLDVDD